MRRLLRDIAEGRALGDVTTLRDPGVMAELEKQIAAEGDEDKTAGRAQMAGRRSSPGRYPQVVTEKPITCGAWGG